jgi:hypothetical protein
MKSIGAFSIAPDPQEDGNAGILDMDCSDKGQPQEA